MEHPSAAKYQQKHKLFYDKNNIEKNLLYALLIIIFCVVAVQSNHRNAGQPKL